MFWHFGKYAYSLSHSFSQWEYWDKVKMVQCLQFDCGSGPWLHFLCTSLHDRWSYSCSFFFHFWHISTSGCPTNFSPELQNVYLCNVCPKRPLKIAIVWTYWQKANKGGSWCILYFLFNHVWDVFALIVDVEK